MREGTGDPLDAVSRWALEAEAVEWLSPFEQIVAGGPGPDLAWFPGARLNVAANCVDRHAATNGDRVAIHFEGEPGDRLSLTYRELADQVDRFAAALVDLGVETGTRVALYLGMVPEVVVGMLACARLGAVHTVLPSALPTEALTDRLSEFDPMVLVTQDGAWRHGVLLPLKARADEALTAIGGIEYTIVVRRTGMDVAWYAGDRWFHEAVARRSRVAEPVAVPSDHPLLVVYLASRRGRPQGLVLRSAGMLVYARTLHRALAASPDDVYWCAMDLGWIAGQTHGIYGPLSAGATTVLYEGTLDTPTHARSWNIIERYRVASLLTSPSVARNLRQWVDSPPSRDRLASLRSIVTAGEVLEPDVRTWLQQEVGGGTAIVRDGWGQTELGGIVAVSPPPQQPLPDPQFDVVDGDGERVGPGESGDLVLRAPWPGQFLGVHGAADAAHDERFWRHAGSFATDDMARRVGDGTIDLLGRRDPMIKVLGQLVSANEVRSVLLEHPFVESAQAVGRPDPGHGEVVVACVVPTQGGPEQDQAHLAGELRMHVEDMLGGLARPAAVAFLAGYPDVPDDRLRRALALLCRERTEPVFELGLEQVEAAIAAAADAG